MTDITNTYLEAAILDQKVAGAFYNKVYAFITVAAKGGWQLGVACANEQGYNPINKFFTTETEAKQWADGLNQHIALSKDEALEIVCSTMGGRRVVVMAK
jgi:hypothetical protein